MDCFRSFLGVAAAPSLARANSNSIAGTADCRREGHPVRPPCGAAKNARDGKKRRMKTMTPVHSFALGALGGLGGSPIPPRHVWRPGQIGDVLVMIGQSGLNEEPVA